MAQKVKTDPIDSPKIIQICTHHSPAGNGYDPADITTVLYSDGTVKTRVVSYGDTKKLISIKTINFDDSK